MSQVVRWLATLAAAVSLPGVIRKVAEFVGYALLPGDVWNLLRLATDWTLVPDGWLAVALFAGALTLAISPQALDRPRQMITEARQIWRRKRTATVEDLEYIQHELQRIERENLNIKNHVDQLGDRLDQQEPLIILLMNRSKATCIVKIIKNHLDKPIPDLDIQHFSNCGENERMPMLHHINRDIRYHIANISDALRRHDDNLSVLFTQRMDTVAENVKAYHPNWHVLPDEPFKTPEEKIEFRTLQETLTNLIKQLGRYMNKMLTGCTCHLRKYQTDSAAKWCSSYYNST